MLPNPIWHKLCKDTYLTLAIENHALRVDFTAIGTDNAHSGTDVVIDNKNCNKNDADFVEKNKINLHISKKYSTFAD